MEWGEGHGSQQQGIAQQQKAKLISSSANTKASCIEGELEMPHCHEDYHRKAPP